MPDPMIPPDRDNPKLQELYESDQSDRQKVYETTGGLQDLKKLDQARRAMVHEMIARGGVNTAVDLYRAGVIYMHGAEPKDFLIAHRFAVLSAIMGHAPARWLAAATLDRFTMSIGMPQTYGTQFEHDPDQNRYQLRLPIEESHLLHFEKRLLGVPQVIERLNQLNRKISGRDPSGPAQPQNQGKPYSG